MDRSKELFFAWLVFYASFITITILMVILGLSGRGVEWYVAAGAVLVGLVLVRYFFLSSKYARHLPGLFLFLAGLNLALLVPELSLRIFGFQFRSGMNYTTEFAYPTRFHFFSRFEPDPDLFWKYQPGQPGVNSWGFKGREITVPKPREKFRMVFLGDSCMEQGYPYEVEKLLNKHGRSTGKRYESVILAVAGYSSHQGRVLAQKYAAKAQPDLVVVCFGWNDHWTAWESTDEEKVVRVPDTGVEKALVALAAHSRLLQLGQWMVHKPPRGQLDRLRVPIERYEYNLRSIHEVFSTHGVPVIFMTAPTPAYKTGFGYNSSAFAASEEAVVKLHRSYNAMVLRVAEESATLLLDLEREVDLLPDAAELFVRDKIHFTPKGAAFTAQRVADFIVQHGY